jgi:RNA-directed DNA polymerase
MEGRDLSSRRASEAARNGRLGNLVTPPSVQKLQTALHAKAKGEPGFRFYALYDKVYREDVLRHAYACCKANEGAAGLDEERFEDIEAYGLDRWLGELAQELKEKTYQPQAARRVYIPKQSGSGLRPLSIPTIRDRTAQTAAKLVLEPIFEADLPAEQHGYRPERNALTAVKQVHSLLNTGHTHVVDADLSAYFDTVPHSELLQSVARRVVDRQMLHLIKMWLETPVEETDERGRKKRTTRSRDEKRGIPQGSPLSPLLSNIYMRRFVLGWKRLGHERRLGARIVSYADDLVICCKGSAEEAQLAMQDIMTRLKLTVNEHKTHVCRVPEQYFDFLGYTFGRFYSTQTGRAYLGTRPSKKSVTRLLGKIHEQTAHNRGLLTADDVVLGLNRTLRGWANYFQLGPVTKAYRLLDRYTGRRLRLWLCHKHRKQGSGTTLYPDEYLYGVLGLVRLPSLTRNLPWATA